MNYQNSTLSYEEEAVINQLNISEKTKRFILEKYPEVVPDIVSHQNLAPFPPKEQIVSYTARIEGVTVLRYEKNKKPYALPYASEGDYSEYLINDEIVLMEFLGEVVIDRLTESLDNEISRLMKRNKTSINSKALVKSKVKSKKSKVFF